MTFEEWRARTEPIMANLLTVINAKVPNVADAISEKLLQYSEVMGTLAELYSFAVDFEEKAEDGIREKLPEGLKIHEIRARVKQGASDQKFWRTRMEEHLSVLKQKSENLRSVLSWHKAEKDLQR